MLCLPKPHGRAFEPSRSVVRSLREWKGPRGKAAAAGEPRRAGPTGVGLLPTARFTGGAAVGRGDVNREGAGDRLAGPSTREANVPKTDKAVPAIQGFRASDLGGCRLAVGMVTRGGLPEWVTQRRGNAASKCRQSRGAWGTDTATGYVDSVVNGDGSRLLVGRTTAPAPAAFAEPARPEPAAEWFDVVPGVYVG